MSVCLANNSRRRKSNDDDLDADQVNREKFAHVCEKIRFKYLDIDTEIIDRLFPRYCAQIFDEICSRLNKKHWFAKKFNSITFYDFLSLMKPNSWLTDEVVNNYIGLVVNRSRGKIGFFNSFFYPTYIKHGYQRVARWADKVDMFNKEKLIIPINENQNHWTVLCLDLLNKKIFYFDSFHSQIDVSFFFDFANKYMADIKSGPSMDGWEVATQIGPRQTNSYDCGVFSCINAEFFSRDITPVFTQSDTPLLRQRILYELLTERLCF